MSATDTDTLAEIFVRVTGDGTVTEQQEESPSHDPIDEETKAVEADVVASTEDGLEDAVEGSGPGG